MITLKIKDTNNTTEFYANLYAGIDDGLNKSASLLRKQIRDITPVRTGALKKSMSVERISGTQSQVNTELEYAPYVELGTVKMAPRSMMRTGFDSNIDAILDEFIRSIKNKI